MAACAERRCQQRLNLKAPPLPLGISQRARWVLAQLVAGRSAEEPDIAEQSMHLTRHEEPWVAAWYMEAAKTKVFLAADVCEQAAQIQETLGVADQAAESWAEAERLRGIPLEELSGPAVVCLLVEGVKLERLARGEPAEIVSERRAGEQELTFDDGDAARLAAFTARIREMERSIVPFGRTSLDGSAEPLHPDEPSAVA